MACISESNPALKITAWHSSCVKFHSFFIEWVLHIHTPPDLINYNYRAQKKNTQDLAADLNSKCSIIPVKRPGEMGKVWFPKGKELEPSGNVLMNTAAGIKNWHFTVNCFSSQMFLLTLKHYVTQAKHYLDFLQASQLFLSAQQGHLSSTGSCLWE